MISRAWSGLVRLASPLTAALVTGTAEPAGPRSRWLRPAVPAWARWLPFATVDLVVVADLALAFILLGTGVSYLETEAVASHFSPDGPVLIVLAAAYAVPVALRERWPVAAWRISAMAAVVGGLVNPRILDGAMGGAAGHGDGVMPYVAAQAITYLLCAYSIAVRADRDVAIGVWIVSMVGAWIIHPNSMFLATVLVTVALLFGQNIRARRRATGRLDEERRRGEEQRAARVVLEERTRIARELHDIVAHHMSVIAIQAEAVPLRAHGDVAALEAGLAEIRVLSLAALAEMRQVLGVLRGSDGRRETAPQPGLDRMDDLIGNVRAAGLAVTAEVSGSLDLPAAVGLSAYRILQESLSNAMRHAPGAPVRAEIERTVAELRLSVTNGPSGAPAPGTPDAPGQGIAGMRERAALLGGTLEAAPMADGGFWVTATLPLAPAEPAAPEEP
ncbi:sensor histidine kinase [Sphaerisporangium sp. NPDC004334]